jgi:hypothetical protein
MKKNNLIATLIMTTCAVMNTMSFTNNMSDFNSPNRHLHRRSLTPISNPRILANSTQVQASRSNTKTEKYSLWKSKFKSPKDNFQEVVAKDFGANLTLQVVMDYVIKLDEKRKTEFAKTRLTERKLNRRNKLARNAKTNKINRTTPWEPSGRNDFAKKKTSSTNSSNHHSNIQ